MLIISWGRSTCKLEACVDLEEGWDSALAEGNPFPHGGTEGYAEIKVRAKDFSPVQGEWEEVRKCESARVRELGRMDMVDRVDGGGTSWARMF